MKRVLVLGGSGLLGTEMKKTRPDWIYTGSELDITSKDIFRHLDNIQPHIIVLAAAKTNSVEISHNAISALKTNIGGPVHIVEWCSLNSIRLIYISTDYVYNFSTSNHREDDPLRPFNLYAWTKLGGECAVKCWWNSLIVRTSFGASEYPYEYAYEDRWVSKDYVDVIAPMIIEAVESNMTGVINIGTERKNLYDWAKERTNEVKSQIQKSPTDFSMDLTRWEMYIKYKE